MSRGRLGLGAGQSHAGKHAAPGLGRRRRHRARRLGSSGHLHGALLGQKLVGLLAGRQRRLQHVVGLLAGERALQGVHQRAGDGEVRATLVLAVEQHPRGKIVVAALEQAVVQLVGSLVTVMAFELLLGHAPAGHRVVVQPLQALDLRFLGHMHEELHHHVAIGHKLLLEVVDGVQVVALLFLGKQQLGRRVVEHMLDDRRVPAAIVERDGVALAQGLPEGLHNGVETRHAAFAADELALGVRIEVEPHVNPGGTGVQVVHEVGNAAALTGAVPALKQHHEPHALVVGLLLEHHELGQKFVPLLLVLRLLHGLLVELDLLEHGFPFPYP